MLTAIMNHGNHNIIKDLQQFYYSDFFCNVSDDYLSNSQFQDAQTCHLTQNRVPVKVTYQASNARTQADINVEEQSKIKLSSGELVCNRYLIIEMLGSGSFGQVIKCYDQVDMEYVAVKFLLTQKQVDESKTEAYILDLISYSDYDRLFVKMKSVFMWKGCKCIVMELLGSNLFDYLRLHTGLSGLPLSSVQSIGYQLFKALNRLIALEIIHCDIKPENIALTDSQSCHIKLIDFGSSCFRSNTIYKYIQSRFYRAPEVILELGYDYSIDMWSVGCVLAELYLGTPIFAGNCELEQLHKFVNVIGPIPTSLVLNSPKFNLFCERLSNGSVVYKQLQHQGNVSVSDSQNLQSCMMNKFLYNIRKEVQDGDFQSIAAFIDLLKKIFVYNPSRRIRPYQALVHPFFSLDLSISSIPSAPYCSQASHVAPQSSKNVPCLINCVQPSGVYQNQIGTTAFVPHGITAYIPTLAPTYVSVADPCPDVHHVKHDGPLVFPMLFNCQNYYSGIIPSTIQTAAPVCGSNYEITPVGHILLPTVNQCDCQKCLNLCMYN